jgi:hypothetical protein
MNYSKFQVVCDIVDSFPNILFNIECFHLLNVIKCEFWANSSIWFKAFTSNNENILLIKLTNTKGLSRFVKVWKHNPFLTWDWKEFASV